jgi:sugar phosphate isomerase/epimerase
MRSLVTRRQFMEQSSLLAAVAGFDLQAPTAGRMFISQNGSVAPRTTWPESARLASRVGYAGIDWNLAQAKVAGLETTRALFAELKLIPTICGSPMSGAVAFGEEAAFRAALPALAADAHFAAGIGCRNMMLVLSPVSPMPRDDRRRLVRERVAAMAEVLQTSGLRLGLEFLGPLCMRSEGGCGPSGGGQRAGGAAPVTPQARIPFIWTLTETVALSREAGPNVGVVLDVWHWYHSGGTVADIVATDSGRIVHVHLSDARPMAPEEVRDNMRLMPGEGQIDITGFLQALHKIGYTGGVAPEPLGRIPPDMAPAEASQLGYDTTRAAMLRAGVA